MNLSTIAPVKVAKSFCLDIQIAKTDSDILQCQSLISKIYYKNLGITFSNYTFNPESKIELYPHHYLMGLVNGELVACIGLYLHSTNPERYGKVTDEEIDKLLEESGASNRYSGKYKRELTKFVVKEEWRNQGIGKFFLGAAHSKYFIHMDEDKPHILVNCAIFSMFKRFWEPLEIRTRILKPVPIYKIHEFYRSNSNPMESRLTIPDIDIPPQWYHLKLPGKYEIQEINSGLTTKGLPRNNFSKVYS
jgi:hypothetical protein